MAKTHIGILELDRETSLPNLRSTKGGVGFEGTTLKYWNGTSWAAVSSTGGISTWDELYDLDKSMTIDSTSMTFALTHATNDGVTFTGGSGSAGDVIQITNAGTGSDIKGTSATWSVSKTGAGDFVSLTGDTVVAGSGSAAGVFSSSGNYDVTLKTGNSTSTQINITDGANGDVTATINGTGKFEIAGTTEANVGFQVTNGDANIADGSLTVTDDDNAASVVITNATVTTANVMTLTADAATSGSILYIDNGGASLTTGYFINCNDDGVADFTVGADGATVITGAVNSSIGLTVTGIQTNENMVVFTSSGITASDKASLLINPSGAIASGGNIVRIAPSGAPNAGAIAIEYVGASKTCQAMYIDGDSTGVAVVGINGGGALTDGFGVLNLTNDGNLATGGNVLNVTMGGTPHTAAAAVEIAAVKDAYALYIASGNATNSGVYITSNGAIADNKAVLEVVATGTPAASGSNVVRIDGSGMTATNAPVLLEIVGDAKDVQGLYIDADPITKSVAYIQAGAALAADKAVLEVVSVPTTNNADSSVLRLTQTHTGGAGFVMTMVQGDVSEPFINFESTEGSGNSLDLTNTGDGANLGFVRVAANGTDAYIKLYGTPAA